MGRASRFKRESRMGSNGNGALKFPNQAVPVVGQPFTLTGIACPINATLTCNCGGAETAVQIIGSHAAPCQSCGKLYNGAFNPQKNAVEFVISMPKGQIEEAKPS